MSFLQVAYGIYVVAASAFIVSENRRPQSAFAWLFLFIFVPVVGLVLYVLFGRMRGGVGRTRKLVRQDLPGHLETTLDRAQAEHDRALERLAAGPPGPHRLANLVQSESLALITTSNEVEVLRNAAEAYPRLFADMEAATASIHLQFYIWRADHLGERLLALLAAKVAAGVAVRILYDPVGSIGLGTLFYRHRMRKAGIDMRPSSPLWRVHTISYRNHRKLAVIDGRVAYTGGLNIGDEHLHPGGRYACWRDTHLRLTGMVVSTLQGVFAVDWANATRAPLLGPEHFPTPEAADGRPVQIVVSGPDSEWRAIRQQYFGMITNATRRLRVQTPYFIPDPSVAEALKAAALSGVDVAVMVASHGPDSRLPYWAARTYFAEIAMAGVEVLLFEDGYLHAKTVVADGMVASVGSGNWDIRSFSINYELNAIIYDEVTAARLEADFDRDRACCRRFDPDAYRALPRPLRFRDSLARLVSPLL